MSARCDDCGRLVPRVETREGPYVDHRGRWHCLACIVGVWSLVEAQERPMTAAEVLYRLYGPKGA